MQHFKQVSWQLVHVSHTSTPPSCTLNTMVTTRLSLLNSFFHLNRSMADTVSLSPPPSPPPPPTASPPPPPPPPPSPPPPRPPSWIWPSCNHPKTHSFKVLSGNEASKAATKDTPYLELSEPCFSNSSVGESESLSTTSEPSVAGDVVEAVIRGLRSDRLVYEPSGASSVAEEAAAATKEVTTSASSSAEDRGCGGAPFEGSVAMALDSRDPYKDFKASMEEMVAAQGGAKDWEWLEEMLAWYLQVNGKGNHVFIVGAFLDLLLSLASSTTSSSSNLSSTSSCSSSFSFEIREKSQEKEEDQKKDRPCTHK